MEGPAQVKILGARYFEEKRIFEKAIDLYGNGGNI